MEKLIISPLKARATEINAVSVKKTILVSVSACWGILTVCSPIVAILGAFYTPAKVVTESLLVGEIGFKLVSSFDMSYETANGRNISFGVERTYLYGFLKESRSYCHRDS